MTFNVKLVAGAAALAATLALSSSTFAQTGATPAPIDCNNAHAMMIKLTTTNAGPFTGTAVMTADIDHNFGSAMTEYLKAQTLLARIEIKCGKNSKAQAMAQKVLDDANAMQQQIDAMMHTP